LTCRINITGQVLTPGGLPLRNVTVGLSGGASTQTAVTDSSGSYRFQVQPGSYVLTPSRSNDQYKTNGVTSFDLALIQAHILQRPLLNAAYKVIAGDANNSAGVTTADILTLRRFLLGTDTTLPGNRIWAFVDGDQTFSAITNPFPFNSTKTLTNQTTDISHTFRGIKIGDVNYDRNPLLDQAPSGDTLRLFGDWTDTEDGYATLRVKSRAVNGILGWQSTLRWDAKQLQLRSVQRSMTNLGIGERWKDDGYLTLSWIDPMAEGLNLTEGVEWMELRFRKTSQLNRVGLNISEEKLVTEAFNKHYQSMGVKLESVELLGSAWNGQLRVYPNPAGRYLNVEWRAETSGSVLIRVLDAAGRKLQEQRNQAKAGVNRQIVTLKGDAGTSGMIIQVVDGDKVQSISVIRQNLP
jgi:hypothetical protein